MLPDYKANSLKRRFESLIEEALAQANQLFSELLDTNVYRLQNGMEHQNRELYEVYQQLVDGERADLVGKDTPAVAEAMEKLIGLYQKASNQLGYELNAARKLQIQRNMDLIEKTIKILGYGTNPNAE